MASINIIILVIALIGLIHPIIRYLWDPKNFRRFPNQNLLSGISNLGYTLERLRGFRSRRLHIIHQQHAVVRIGPNSLSFSSPSAIQSIYSHSTPCIKGDVYQLARGSHSNVLDAVHKGEYAQKRRLLSLALSNRNLETWEFKIIDKVERLVRQFDSVCDSMGESKIDFRLWSNLFTIDAISDIALSWRPDCLDRGTDSVTISTIGGCETKFNFIDCLHAGRRATSIVIWPLTWYPLLFTVLEKIPGFFRSQWRKGKHFDELVHHLTHQRIRRFRDGQHRDDLVGYLFENREGIPRDFDFVDVKAEITAMSKSVGQSSYCSA